ncbi:RING finger protein 225-like [Ambystoma mexicanum]|uniref:RING finger protein 225-like n=1 Tax=Ambystoma mexicanum TaxID=8296 RepID=UPI0037E70483
MVLLYPCPAAETMAAEEVLPQAAEPQQEHQADQQQEQQQNDDEQALQHTDEASIEHAEQQHQHQQSSGVQEAEEQPQPPANEQPQPPADEEQAVEQPRQPANDTDSNDGDAECIICFTAYDGVFKLPKLLRCGHTFCLECLARINVSSEMVTSLNCPICRDTTRLPARRGLPALDNNQDILEQLPQELRPTRSVRFSRKKGLLYVKNLPSPQSPLPKPLQLSTVSLSLDVGRPPPRVRVPPSFGRGSCLFYATVAIAILLTVAVVMVGVYIFFIVPSNSSTSSNSSSSGNGPPSTIPISNTPNNSVFAQTLSTSNRTVTR